MKPKSVNLYTTNMEPVTYDVLKKIVDKAEETKRNAELLRKEKFLNDIGAICPTYDCETLYTSIRDELESQITNNPNKNSIDILLAIELRPQLDTIQKKYPNYTVFECLNAYQEMFLRLYGNWITRYFPTGTLQFDLLKFNGSVVLVIPLPSSSKVSTQT